MSSEDTIHVIMYEAFKLGIQEQVWQGVRDYLRANKVYDISEAYERVFTIILKQKGYDTNDVLILD